MLSHKDRLFILSYPPRSRDRNRHLYILELLEIDGRLKWHKLPNARCPVQQSLPAFFGGGNSLVIAGGHSSANHWPRACSAYDLLDNEWVTTTEWLPDRVSALQSVTVDNCVHLIGGHDKTLAPSSATFCVHLIKKDGCPTSDQTGTTNALPDTPHGQCGACHVHGNVVVAGGYDSINLKVQQDVFVFDKSSAKWLKLPELTIARCHSSLVYFRGSLLAIGGSQISHGFHSRMHKSVDLVVSEVEELPLPWPSASS